MARKSKKRLNGQGNSITLNFNANDPEEAAALAMAKRLAGLKKGKRKDFIVALLAAAEHIYQETGQLLETHEIAAAISGHPAVTGRQRIITPTVSVTQVTGQEQRPSTKQHSVGIEVTQAKKSDGTQNVANNFLSSMKSLASGFFD